MSRDIGLLPTACAIASLALRYPSADVVARREDAVRLAGDLPDGPVARPLRRFLAWGRTVPPLELEQAYVETFDLRRRSCLYLSYYLYGDRRQRGQEFVRLKHRVEDAGLRVAGRELPDSLPLLLEVAALDPDTGAAVLTEHRVGLELLQAALHDAGSPYGEAVDAICAGLPPLDRAGREVAERLAAEGPPGEQVGLEPFAPPEVMPPSAWDGVPR